MADLWEDVRRDVMRRLEDHAPTVPFEDRVRIAEDAAREVKSDAELFTPANVNAARVYRDCGHPADVEIERPRDTRN